MRRYVPSRATLLVSFLSIALFAVGCKTGSSQKDDSLTSQKPQVPGFFKEIPADTKYVYTGLEPFPADTVRHALEQANDAGSFSPAGLAQRILSNMPAQFPMLEAIAAELEGKVNAEGLQELGFELESHYAVYGVGGIPVVRLELGDEEAFEAMLNRVETESETEVAMQESDGITYRLYSGRGDLVLPMVVRDGAVVTTAATVEPEVSQVVLPYLLGQKTPERSLADVDDVRDLADNYGYEEFGIGYADLERAIGIYSGAIEPDPLTASVMEATGYEPPELSEDCVDEIGEMAASVPRLVFGIQELSNTSIQLHGGLEIASEYSEQMAGAVEPVPARESDVFKDAALSLGFGLDVQELITVMRNRAQNISDSPYQCEEFDDINNQARRMKDRPIPPAVEQLLGASLVLEGVDFGRGQFRPNNIEAIAIVQTANPQALLGRLQSIVPGLMQADVQDDGVPVALQQLGNMINFLKSPHIAMTEDVVAFSAGVGMQDELGALLEDEPAPDASMTAMAFGYNLAKIQRSLPDGAKNVLKQMVGDSYADAMHGSNAIEIQFTGRGVFVETRSRETGEADGETEKADASTGSETSN